MTAPSPEQSSERIFVDDTTLQEAITGVRFAKEAALDAEDHEAARDLREREKILMAALGGVGLSITDAELLA